MPLTKANVHDIIQAYVTDEKKMKTLIEMCVAKATQLLTENLVNLQTDIVEKIETIADTRGDLIERVAILEQKITANRIHMDLLRRKLDDTEQYTRRPNLIVDGIPVTPGESPATLRKKLLAEIHKLKIEVDERDVDRIHRHETPSHDQKGNKIQPVIVRLPHGMLETNYITSASILATIFVLTLRQGANRSSTLRGINSKITMFNKLSSLSLLIETVN